MNTPPNNFLNLFKVNVLKNNKSGSWIFASRNKESLVHRAMNIGGPVPVNELKPDAVQIVAIVEDNQTLLVNREFRIPLANYELACPAGMIDVGESVIDAADRELREEVGYQIKKVRLITPPLFSSAGLCDESMSTVVATVEKSVEDSSQEEMEDIEAVFLSPSDAAEIAAGNTNGDYISAKSWPFIFAWAYMKEIFEI